MNTHELFDLLDREGTLASLDKGLMVNVRILDARNVYGKVRVEVKPLDGGGKKWVDLARVTLPAPVVGE